MKDFSSFHNNERLGFQKVLIKYKLPNKSQFKLVFLGIQSINKFVLKKYQNLTFSYMNSQHISILSIFIYI